MLIREFSRRIIWAVALLIAIVISVIWGFYDAQPSSKIRYGALGFAMVLVLSAYLYFTSSKNADSVISDGESQVLKVIRENARWLITCLTIIFAAVIYACENRYQVIAQPRDFPQAYVKVLDRWTGEVSKKY